MDVDVDVGIYEYIPALAEEYLNKQHDVDECVRVVGPLLLALQVSVISFG